MPRITESGKVRFIAAKLFVADTIGAVSANNQQPWVRAKQLVAEQMREFGWQEDDLGEIVLAD